MKSIVLPGPVYQRLCDYAFFNRSAFVKQSFEGESGSYLNISEDRQNPEKLFGNFVAGDNHSFGTIDAFQWTKEGVILKLATDGGKINVTVIDGGDAE